MNEEQQAFEFFGEQGQELYEKTKHTEHEDTKVAASLVSSMSIFFNPQLDDSHAESRRVNTAHKQAVPDLQYLQMEAKADQIVQNIRSLRTANVLSQLSESSPGAASSSSSMDAKRLRMMVLQRMEPEEVAALMMRQATPVLTIVDLWESITGQRIRRVRQILAEGEPGNDDLLINLKVGHSAVMIEMCKYALKCAYEPKIRGLRISFMQQPPNPRVAHNYLTPILRCVQQEAPHAVNHYMSSVFDMARFPKQTTMLAGGAILTALEGRWDVDAPHFIKDVDCFLRNIPPTAAAVTHVVESIEACIKIRYKIVKTPNTTTFFFGWPHPPFQVIERPTNTIEETLACFDSDCCCVACYFDDKKGEPQFVTIPRGLRALTTHFNHYDAVRTMETSSVRRMAKYARKEYDVILDESCIHVPRCEPKIAKCIGAQVIKLLHENDEPRFEKEIRMHQEVENVKASAVSGTYLSFGIPHGPAWTLEKQALWVDEFRAEVRKRSKFLPAMAITGCYDSLANMKVWRKGSQMPAEEINWRERDARKYGLHTRCYVCRKLIDMTSERMCVECRDKTTQHTALSEEIKSKYADKMALVIGGRDGIGGAVVKRLRAAGCTVHATSSREWNDVDHAADVFDHVDHVDTLDLQSPDSIQEFVATLDKLARHSPEHKFDIVVFNAARTVMWDRTAMDVPFEEFQSAMQINCLGYVQILKGLVATGRLAKDARVILVTAPEGIVQIRQNGPTYQRLHARHELALRKGKMAAGSPDTEPLAAPRTDSRHPHTNMAKAAINMFFMTASADMAIHNQVCLTASDPGWVNHMSQKYTDDFPARVSTRPPPISLETAAARVMWPFEGVHDPYDTVGKVFGHFCQTDW